MPVSLRRFVFAAASLFGVIHAGTSLANDQPKTPTIMAPTEVIYEHVVHSDLLGRDMRLLVWKPDHDAPKDGYPVIYSFDGETSITALAEFAAQAEVLGARYKLGAPMVVAFAEMPGDYSHEQRMYDFTPFAKTYELHERPNMLEWPKLGGGDTYLEAVMTEFKPFIAQTYAIDKDRETLFGHSLGGMLVLHMLATRPDAFDAYVAVSPSLWFNTPQRFDEISTLLADPGFAPARPVPLMMTVGADESDLTKWDMRLPEDMRSRRLEWKKINAMVDNARKMAGVIAKEGAGKIDLDFSVLDRTNHHTAKPITMYRAIEMAMTPR
ncbi:MULTISPECIES: alpha/beta hydrolase [Thalassospira]|uniref:Alpha/beta hydrolase-fold protein n=1 Tax=Thalassospira aquimaris TaxID=3037796 RepID=A0ABT6GHD0_9PROT|nr:MULTISPECIES: alpha/beta fold hydrolase [Thalassospira]MDG4721480.1 alpha/beta hydrolase-fold protein [Thalassospira sp. FZY0004]